MARAGFDYGGVAPVTGGKSFVNPVVGKHVARLRSLIHLGMFADEFKGKRKDPAPYVCAVFELKEEHDVDGDGQPLVFRKTFPLRDGDKGFLTKFMNALDKDGTATGFDDFIGRQCELDLKGSDETGDDGLPKYINLPVDCISSVHPKLAQLTEELSVKGAGHVKFDAITKEAILELHPIVDVADILLSEHNSSYAANPTAVAAIAEIRKENPDFAVRKASDAKGKPAAAAAANKPAANPATPPPDLDPDENF